MRCFVVLLLFCTLSLTASAQINNWIKTASGNWEDPANWSLGLRPSASQSIGIANPGYKAVGISSSTVANFPAALTINNLSISGPTDTLNTLLLNYAGTVGLCALMIGRHRCSLLTSRLFRFLAVGGPILSLVAMYLFIRELGQPGTFLWGASGIATSAIYIFFNHLDGVWTLIGL